MSGPTTTVWAHSRVGRKKEREREREGETSGRTRPLALPSQIRRTLPVAGKIADEDAGVKEPRQHGSSPARPRVPPILFLARRQGVAAGALQFTETTSRRYIPGTWSARTFLRETHGLNSRSFELRVGNSTESRYANAANATNPNPERTADI